MAIGTLCRATARFCTALASKCSYGLQCQKTAHLTYAGSLVSNQFDSSPQTAWKSVRGLRTSAVRHARDYYEVLGVDKHASASDIKKAFYRLAKQYHPDTNPDPKAREAFQEIQKAYNTLKDEEKRRTYDRLGTDSYEQADAGAASGAHGFRGFSGGFRQGGFEFYNSPEEFESIFQNFFGSSFRNLRPETTLSITLSLEEAAKGCSKTVVLEDEFGKINDVLIQVPPGIDNGMTLRANMRGQGSQSLGSVLLRIKVSEHKVFKRDGPHIHVDVPIKLTDALLGCNVDVKTLDGLVSVRIPPGTQNGDKQVLRGRGIQELQSLNRGNQYLHFNVTMPRDLTAQQRELVQKLAESINDRQYPIDR